MRKLVFKSKTTRTIKQMTTAIAWATAKRGGYAWQDELSVAAQMLEFFREHNVVLADGYEGNATGRITYTMQRLVKEGYADIEVNSHRRIVLFTFKSDVEITGHLPEFSVPVNKGVTEQGVEWERKGRTVNFTLPGGPGPMPLPPVLRHRAGDLNDWLDVWYGKDPEGYGKWVDDVIERLGALYG